MATREETPLDQEVFDKTLAAELGKGTDRRVAEGRARSAAVRAYRKVHGEPAREQKAPAGGEAAAATGDGGAAGGDGGGAPAPVPAVAPAGAPSGVAPAGAPAGGQAGGL